MTLAPALFEPTALVVVKPAGMTPEGFAWAATQVQREADRLGLHVTVARSSSASRVFLALERLRGRVAT